MTVRKNPAGGWICELYPNGAKGKRIRKNSLLRARLWRLSSTPFKTRGRKKRKTDGL